MATTATQTAVKAAEPVLEEVAKVVDETVETVARIPRLRLNGTTRAQQIVILGVTAAAGAAVGSAITYKIVKSKMQTEYEKLLDEGIKEAKEYYKVFYKKGEYADPIEALSKYSDKVAEATAQRDAEAGDEELVLASQGDFEQVGTEAPPQELRDLTEKGPKPAHIPYNVFTNPPPEFMEEGNTEARDKGLPHVIAKEDYLVNEEEFGEVNATYYLGDGILAGEDDMPIENVETLVGEDNLLRFGYLSGDNNVVFIRNPRTRTMYEIVRSTGSYAKEVHDVEPEPQGELRHGHKSPRKFRDRHQDD